MTSTIPIQQARDDTRRPRSGSLRNQRVFALQWAWQDRRPTERRGARSITGEFPHTHTVPCLQAYETLQTHGLELIPGALGLLSARRCTSIDTSQWGTDAGKLPGVCSTNDERANERTNERTLHHWQSTDGYQNSAPTPASGRYEIDCVPRCIRWEPIATEEVEVARRDGETSATRANTRQRQAPSRERVVLRMSPRPRSTQSRAYGDRVEIASEAYHATPRGGLERASERVSSRRSADVAKEEEEWRRWRREWTNERMRANVGCVRAVLITERHAGGCPSLPLPLTPCPPAHSRTDTDELRERRHAFG